MSPLPHPAQLNILDFNAYALVIDARSPREHAEDHLPHAVNLPVVDNDEYAGSEPSTSRTHTRPIW